MYHNKHILSDYQVRYSLKQFAPLEQILFLDIETTGLSPVNSQLYLIGLAFYENGSWCIEQYMAERPIEERQLLLELSQILPRFTHIFHFNGNRFDIPYLMEKAKEHFVELDFSVLTGIDIYRRISPYKQLLVLPDCRQKTIEQFLGISRIDKYTGGELIHIYQAYTKSQNEDSLQLLLQHNLDDMQGMLDIVPVLSYCDLLEKSPSVYRVELLRSKNARQEDVYELSMHISLVNPIPKRIFAYFDNNYLIGEGGKLTIKVPVYEKELKFFYANHKNYYYFPELDAAFHKSVAAKIDGGERRQATAATCYTRKEGAFLKQYDVLVEPFFKENYKDKASYFEITEETKQNRQLFTFYSRHILEAIIQSR